MTSAMNFTQIQADLLKDKTALLTRQDIEAAAPRYDRAAAAERALAG